MIKNIPNKYNQKMLLAAVDEHHKGSYDFFYLPIDFKVLSYLSTYRNRTNAMLAMHLSILHLAILFEAFMRNSTIRNGRDSIGNYSVIF